MTRPAFPSGAAPALWLGEQAPAPPPAPGDSRPSVPSGGVRPPRVLMVDDEELIRQMAVGMARRIQVDLVGAGTAAEALAIAATRGIDVLIADVSLGEGMDGVELAREMSALYPGLPVVLMSGYYPAEFDLGGLPPGTQFLVKPFTGESLARCIAAARQHTSTSP